MHGPQNNDRCAYRSASLAALDRAPTHQLPARPSFDQATELVRGPRRLGQIDKLEEARVADHGHVVVVDEHGVLERMGPPGVAR